MYLYLTSKIRHIRPLLRLIVKMRTALDGQLNSTRLGLESKMNSVTFELDRLHKLLQIRPTTSEFQQVSSALLFLIHFPLFLPSFFFYFLLLFFTTTFLLLFFSWLRTKCIMIYQWTLKTVHFFCCIYSESKSTGDSPRRNYIN